MSPEIVADHERLKKELLRGFCKTPDGYCLDFRNAKMKQGETYKQFSVNLGQLFDQWVDACNIDRT